MKKIAYIVLLFSGIFISCKKQDTSSTFADIPVVQSYMLPGQPLNLNVSRQIPLDPTTAQYSADNINALPITLTYSNVVHTLKPLGSGNYVDSSIIIKVGSSYSVSFQYNGKQTSAYTIVPAKPTGYTESDSTISIAPITGTGGGGGYGVGGGTTGSQPNPIALTWNNFDNSNYVIIVENMEANPVLINTSSTATAPTSRRFRIKPTTSNNYTIRSRTFQYYGMTRLILYHINPDYASLYDNSENSSQNLTNPSTSIINGYGIFTATNSDTLYVNVKPQ